MKAFAALLKVSFQGLLVNTLSMGGNRRKAVSGGGAFGLLCLLVVFISGSYSFSMAMALAPLGGLDIMLITTMAMGLFLALVFTLFSAQGLVFSGKDIDLVFSLPVSAFSVILSRLLALYLEILLIVQLMLLPAGIAWLVFGGGGGALFLLLLVVEGVFLAFVPTLASLVFGGVVSLLVSRLRFKNLFTVVFSLVLTFAAIAGSMFISAGAETMEQDITLARDSIAGAMPPLAFAVEAVARPSLPGLLAVAAVCLLPFLAVAWLFSRFYKRLLTWQLGQKTRRNYKLSRLSAQKPLAALFKKEARRFFGTPIYLLNSGMGVLMVLVGAVVALVGKPAIDGFFLEAERQGLGALLEYLPAALLAALLFLLLTVYPSAVSVSMEGKNLWVLKEAPLATRQIFAAKAGFGFVLGAAPCLVAVPLLGVALSVSAAHTVAILLVCVLFAAFTSLAGLYINLLFPRLDVDNDTTVVKQSGSVLLSMLAGLGGLVLVGGVFVLACPVAGLGFLPFAALAAALLLLLCAGLLRLLNTRGVALFLAL